MFEIKVVLNKHLLKYVNIGLHCTTLWQIWQIAQHYGTAPRLAVCLVTIIRDPMHWYTEQSDCAKGPYNLSICFWMSLISEA